MIKAVQIFLLAFYSLGTFCLPMGDFSMITDLPAMYRHCKATEDKDMTPFDFVTDHLLNIDGLFDKHDNGDQQKPHTPMQFHHQITQNYFTTPENKAIEYSIAITSKSLPHFEDSHYSFGYLSNVFRPPII